MLKIKSDKDITAFPACPITGASQPPVNKGDVFYVLNKEEIQQIRMLANMLAKKDEDVPQLQERIKRMVVTEESLKERNKQMQENTDPADKFNVMLKADYEALSKT